MNLKPCPSCERSSTTMVESDVDEGGYVLACSQLAVECDYCRMRGPVSGVSSLRNHGQAVAEATSGWNSLPRRAER